MRKLSNYSRLKFICQPIKLTYAKFLSDTQGKNHLFMFKGLEAFSSQSLKIVQGLGGRQNVSASSISPPAPILQAWRLCHGSVTIKLSLETCFCHVELTSWWIIDLRIDEPAC